MKYTRLGASGPRISVVGLGFWQAGSRLWGGRNKAVRDVVGEIVVKAVEHGINFFDTAEIYGGGLSEKILGEAIRETRVKSEVIVASKIAGYRWRPGDIVKAVERINRRLGFKVDLIQHHWPPPTYASICSVVKGLEKTIEQGLASYYGLSNYNAGLLQKALECTKKTEPVSNQVQYSLAYRVVENKLKPIMEDKGMTLIAWSPLAKGALAGLREPRTIAQRTDRVFKATAGDENLQRILGVLSDKYRVSRATIALAWLVSKNTVPIPGTLKPKRVEEYAAAGTLELGQNDVRLLDEASSKYVYRWGECYGSLGLNRFLPGILLKLGILLMGGI